MASMEQNGCEKKKLLSNWAKVFKNLQMPEDILDEIIETLNAAHQDKD